MKKTLLLALSIFPSQINAQTVPSLKHLTQSSLLADFDLAVSSLREAHPGLNWYTTYAQMDSLIKVRRAMISDDLTALQFYRILAPVIIAAREGHCKISLSAAIDDYLSRQGLYPPIFIKFVGERPYLINDIQGLGVGGMEISAINGIPWKQLRDSIFGTISSDGFNLTKKYATLEGQDFSYYYLDVFDQSENYDLELFCPENNVRKQYRVRAVNSAWLDEKWKSIKDKYFDDQKAPSGISIDGTTAVLSYHTFKADRFDDFKKTTDEYFKKIEQSKITNLIIDLRNNGGGAEGYEDYVFAYLSSKPYRKYSYVQAAAFSYSFYPYTDRNTAEKQASLELSLREEHSLNSDGRILRKAGILEPEKPKADAFKGNIFVLIHGNTYSGGSELASLIRAHCKAIFIGQETGGGFYGNTSGFSLKLTLPNSGLELKIPLLKFVLDVSDQSYPFGHGVIPDYITVGTYQDFLNGTDKELQVVYKLIKAN